MSDISEFRTRGVPFQVGWKKAAAANVSEIHFLLSSSLTLQVEEKNGGSTMTGEWRGISSLDRLWWIFQDKSAHDPLAYGTADRINHQEIAATETIDQDEEPDKRLSLS